MGKRKRIPLELANGPTPKIIPQGDDCPQIYLSNTVVHTTKLEEEFLRCSGVRYRCASFVYVCPGMFYHTERSEQAYTLDKEKKMHIMMDSGAFSFHMFVTRHRDQARVEALRHQTIKDYVKFCHKDSKHWDFYVTFDYKQHCPTIWQITKELEAEGLTPAPVYHGDDSFDWLKKYLDAGYKRIGISTLPRRRQNYRKQRMYLDEVFRVTEPYKVKLHGFAITALSLAFAYPWHSVDSSSWSRISSFGSIVQPNIDRGSLSSAHVSLAGHLSKDSKSVTSLSPVALKSLRDSIENLGWDFDLMRHSLTYRMIYNGWFFSHLNKFKKQLSEPYVTWGSVI